MPSPHIVDATNPNAPSTSAVLCAADMCAPARMQLGANERSAIGAFVEMLNDDARDQYAFFMPVSRAAMTLCLGRVFTVAHGGLETMPFADYSLEHFERAATLMERAGWTLSVTRVGDGSIDIRLRLTRDVETMQDAIAQEQAEHDAAAHAAA